MPTRTATRATNGYRVVVTVSSRAVFSDDEAAHAAEVVGEWLRRVHPEVTTAALLKMREEYLAAAKGDGRPKNTSYGLVAEEAVTQRWAPPHARVLVVVDIVPLDGMPLDAD